METLLPAVLGAAPQLGGATLLVLVVVLLLRREGTELERTRTAYATELSRVSAARDAELVELRAEITRLREALKALDLELDDERGRRRAAEDAAGRHRSTEPEGPSPWAAG